MQVTAVAFAGPFEVNGYHVNISSPGSLFIKKDDDQVNRCKPHNRLLNSYLLELVPFSNRLCIVCTLKWSPNIMTGFLFSDNRFTYSCSAE